MEHMQGEWIYGRNPVHEVLRAGRRSVRRIMVAAGVREKGVVSEVLSRAKQAGIVVVRVPRRELDTVNPHSQGLAALVSPYPYADLEGILSRRQGERGLILLLDLLQDPQNMGTLLRTAEAVGVDGVVLAPRRGVAITPAVVAASSGACEHLLIAMHNIARALEKLKEAGFWMLGLENRAEAQAFHEVGLPSALGLVVGSEGAGLRRLVADSCDWIVRLPMRGHIGSLNASVAGSIMLYEICRQQGFWEENGDAASDRRAKDPEVGGR